MTTESLITLATGRPDTESGFERPIAETTTRQRLFGIHEASARTGLAVWRIYSEVSAAHMPCKRVGRRIYFSEADILAYFRRIQMNEVPPGDLGHATAAIPEVVSEPTRRLDGTSVPPGESRRSWGPSARGLEGSGATRRLVNSTT